MTIVRDARIEITSAEVARREALRMGGRVHPKVRALIPQVLETVAAEALIQPAIALADWPVAAANGAELRLGNGAIFADAPRLAERLANAEELTAAAGTIGGRLDRRVSDLFAARQPMRALVLEEIGILAVAKLGQIMQERARAGAQTRGLDCSSAMSPGETGFALEAQPIVLALAGAEAIGIRAAASAMLPIKSLSMVFGVGRDMPRWSGWEVCAGCASRDRCRYRSHAPEEEVRP